MNKEQTRQDSDKIRAFFLIDVGTKAKLKSLGVQRGCSMSELVSEAVRRYLEDTGER